MDTINLGILAHVDAGKTTATEALLYRAGAIRRAGRVDHGDTVTDSLAVERARGITVRTSTASLRHRGVKINLIDTPGHMDFIAEVERSLGVLDAAVLLLSAREGVQSQTKVLFDALRRLGIPAILFINKLDRAGADYEGTLCQIRAQLTEMILPRQIVSPERVETRPLALCEDAVERLFDADPETAGRFAQGEPLGEAQLRAGYLRAVSAAALYPVYAGAALSGLGIPQLLDAIAADLPRAGQQEGARSALVYKLEFHERLGRLCYLRLYGAPIRLRDRIAPVEGGEPFRVTMLFTPDMGGLCPAAQVGSGDIAAIPCGPQVRVGSALGERMPPVKHTQIAQPMLLVEVGAEESAAGEPVPREKLLDALECLCAEDPLLHLARNEHTGALELKVFGAVQMEILTELAWARYGIRLLLGKPRTIFREVPARVGEGDVRWGETPFRAAVRIRVAPRAEGEGLGYESKVDYGYLTASYQAAVRDGILDALRHARYGWALTDALVTLEDAVYDSVSSTPADFRGIAPVAVIRALEDAGTELLEPMLAYQLIVPRDLAGRAAYDLTTMRATIEEALAQGERIAYRGRVSLDSSKEYARAVASYTKGTGVFTVRQCGYAPFRGDPAAAVNVGRELPSERKYLLIRSGRMA